MTTNLYPQVQYHNPPAASQQYTDQSNMKESRSAEVNYYSTNPQIPQEHNIQPVMSYQPHQPNEYHDTPQDPKLPQVPKKKNKRTCLKVTCITFGIIALIVLILLVAGGIAGIVVGVRCATSESRKVADFDFNLATASIKTLRVTGVGDVKFMKGNHDARIYGTLNVKSRRTEGIRGSLSLDPNDPSVLVLHAYRPQGWSFACLWIDRVIYLPNNSFTQNLVLEIDIDSYNFEAQSGDTFMFKSANIRTDSGDIKLNNLETRDSMTVRTDSGNIAAQSIIANSTATFRTSSGNIRVNYCSATEITATTSSGNQDIKIQKAELFTTRADSGNVKVSVQNFTGSFDTSTNSGSNSISNESPRELNYSTKTEYTKRGYVGYSTLENKLRVKTDSGNIKITFL